LSIKGNLAVSRNLKAGKCGCWNKLTKRQYLAESTILYYVLCLNKNNSLIVKLHEIYFSCGLISLNKVSWLLFIGLNCSSLLSVSEMVISFLFSNTSRNSAVHFKSALMCSVDWFKLDSTAIFDPMLK
jgi:hypothetical protein